MNVIEVNHLQKRYGAVTAVADISFQVEQNEIFSIVGPNGAGKTTTVEILIGLRQPDSGTVQVLGLNPQKQASELRQRIGIQLQQAALPKRMKVWEALDMYAAFYEKTIPWEPLLEQWGLGEKRNAVFHNLSGGQKQRLFIALALLNDPEVVFLDELTTGLDPQARHATWDAVRAIRDQGKTVVLVTHFMDEAQELADRVAIIDQGNVVALNTPQGLIDGLGASSRVRFTNPNGFSPDVLRPLTSVTNVEQHGQQVIVHGTGPLLVNVAQALASHNVSPADLRIEQADLEDVFLSLTGSKIRV
jgi:ABC-2 type transport system ATP-binding protein